MLSHPYSCLLRQNMLRTFTNSSQPMRPICVGINDARCFFKNYRPYWSAKSPLNAIKRTSNLLFYVIYSLLMPFFHSQAAILKTKQQLSSWIVASGHREHVMISIFQMKPRPQCQIDEDSVCSQTFSHILGLIRGQQRVLLVFAPLHTRSGAFTTDTSHMSVRFYCECKCLGSILWPRRLNVVYVFFFFIVTSLCFVVFCLILFLWWNSLFLRLPHVPQTQHKSPFLTSPSANWQSPSDFNSSTCIQITSSEQSDQSNASGEWNGSTDAITLSQRD